MNIKSKIIPNTIILKSHVNRYTFLGLAISLGSIIIASCVVSYQLIGNVSLEGFVAAQTSNPAIWILDLTPFWFVYWGQSFCEGIVNKAQSILSDKTEEFLKISDSLEQKLRYESNHDSLTKLANSRMFGEQVSHSISQLGAEGQLAIIVVKINDFDNISYNFGTFNANNVLKQYADKLKTILMEPYILQSTLGLCNVARLNGEEFAFLLPKLKPDFNSDELLSAMNKSLTTNFVIDGINVNITTSSGLAIYPMHGLDEGILLNHANIALHNAKKQGMPYLLYKANMEEDFTQNRLMMNELKRAIENNELIIFFQPVVDLHSGKIVGAESLARFEHPQYGLISAEKFIPLVEGTTLIHLLTSFMLKGVIKQLARWHEAGHHIFASVNLSVQDAADRDLPTFIGKLLADHEIDPKYLKLEFNERACLTDQSVTIEVLDKLSKMGLKLSIDDFCSGYSSFIYLFNFPINDIKIEKSYVLNMMKDPKKNKIVEVILKLTDALGLETVADGVTDEPTVNRLKELGCSYGQGFYFSRPVDETQFKTLLENKVTA